MRTTRSGLGITCLCLLVGALAMPHALAAQDVAAPPPARPPGPPPPNAADTIDLVFDREVFAYPSFEQRRDPFRALTSTETGPRFENLALQGRILDSDPGRSVALLLERSVGSSQQGGSRTHRVRVGDVLGNTRIIEIRPEAVVVEVDDFGVLTVRTLVLERRAPTATPAAPGSVPVGPDGSPGAGVTLPPNLQQVPGQVGPVVPPVVPTTVPTIGMRVIQIVNGGWS